MKLWGWLVPLVSDVKCACKSDTWRSTPLLGTQYLISRRISLSVWPYLLPQPTSFKPVKRLRLLSSFKRLYWGSIIHYIPSIGVALWKVDIIVWNLDYTNCIVDIKVRIHLYYLNIITVYSRMPSCITLYDNDIGYSTCCKSHRTQCVIYL